MLFTLAMACLPQRKSLQPASGTHTSAPEGPWRGAAAFHHRAWFLPWSHIAPPARSSRRGGPGCQPQDAGHRSAESSAHEQLILRPSPMPCEPPATATANSPTAGSASLATGPHWSPKSGNTLMDSVSVRRSSAQEAETLVLGFPKDRKRGSDPTPAHAAFA